jgi:hypothetical protein
MNTRLQRRPFRNSGKVHGKRLQDLGRCHHARDLDRLPCRAARWGLHATAFEYLGDAD